MHMPPKTFHRRCTCISSAIVLALDGINGEGIGHPFVYKVMHSAGYKRKESQRWMNSLQQGRFVVFLYKLVLSSSILNPNISVYTMCLLQVGTCRSCRRVLSDHTGSSVRNGIWCVPRERALLHASASLAMVEYVAYFRACGT